MIFESVRYAWNGSISRANAWGPVVGAMLLWVTLALFGYEPALPQNWIQAVFVVFFCTVAAWVVIFSGKLLYAPYHLLKRARAELNSLQGRPPLEILFDSADPAYVGLRPEMYPSTPIFVRDYCIKIRNNLPGGTIDDVSVHWDETPFTQFIDWEVRRCVLLESTSIHPLATEKVWLFGLGRNRLSGTGVLAEVQKFTIRARGKDAREVVATFEYDPGKDPMVRRLADEGG